MIQIIITGHGQFASGVLSSVKLIAGEQSGVQIVDFAESDSTEVLKHHIEAAIGTNEKVLILTDLAGGSPYNCSVMIKSEQTEKEIEVLSGTNLAMVLACVFSGETEDLKLLADEVMGEGKQAISLFELAVHTEVIDEEDGI